MPAFAKGELKIHIKPFKMNVFGERINEPDTVYFLSLPQYPKDSLIIDLKEAVERGEILTEPIREDKTLYPEAVELRPSDYIVALIKIGTLTYTDEVIQIYAKNLKDREQTIDDIDDPLKFQRQRATLLAKLKAAVEKFDLDRVYYLRHKVITRGYDSKRSGYAWEPGIDGPLLWGRTRLDHPSLQKRKFPSSPSLLTERSALRSALIQKEWVCRHSTSSPISASPLGHPM